MCSLPYVCTRSHRDATIRSRNRGRGRCHGQYVAPSVIQRHDSPMAPWEHLVPTQTTESSTRARMPSFPISLCAFFSRDVHINSDNFTSVAVGNLHVDARTKATGTMT